MTLPPEQVKQAAAAALEVLSGAPHPRILQIVETLALSKSLLAMIASGECVVVHVPAEPPK